MSKNIAGFSKKTKEEKIDWLIATYFSENKEAKKTLLSYWNSDLKLQQLHDEFIENTVSNFYFPLGIAPNFIINQKEFTIPMVIEESSVLLQLQKQLNIGEPVEDLELQYWDKKKLGKYILCTLGHPKSYFLFSIQLKPSSIKIRQALPKI